MIHRTLKIDQSVLNNSHRDETRQFYRVRVGGVK